MSAPPPARRTEVTGIENRPERVYETEPQAEGVAALRERRLVRERSSAPRALGPESFLRHAGAWPRGFWQRGDRWYAWSGTAARISSRSSRPDACFPPGARRFEAVRRRAESLLAGGGAEARAARWHGGVSFTPERTGLGPWSGFPSIHFALPSLEASGAPSGTVLTATRLEAARGGPPGGAGPGPGVGQGFSSGDASPAPSALLDALLDRAAASPAEPPSASESEGFRVEPVGGLEPACVEPGSEGREAWGRAVERVLRAIRAGEARKVVLARALEVRLPEPPDTLRLLARLRAFNGEAGEASRQAGEANREADGVHPRVREAHPRGYLFLVEPEPGRVFLGAAPELLGALSDGTFHATAVAGTIRRGADRREDERLARRLLTSAKDREEHQIGVEDMCQRLARLARGARVDREPHVVRLNRVQHLRTDLTVPLPGGGHILTLVGALHPTAAVCGYPGESALRLLLEEEAFARGWYAAPVGWFDGEGNGEFAPGLRSAVIQGSRAWLYAGAGIVEGSCPDREWEETRLKFGPMLQVLGASAPG